MNNIPVESPNSGETRLTHKITGIVPAIIFVCHAVEFFIYRYGKKRLPEVASQLLHFGTVLGTAGTDSWENSTPDWKERNSSIMDEQPPTITHDRATHVRDKPVAMRTID